VPDFTTRKQTLTTQIRYAHSYEQLETNPTEHCLHVEIATDITTRNSERKDT
jgi:hypothetical protein